MYPHCVELCWRDALTATAPVFACSTPPPPRTVRAGHVPPLTAVSLPLATDTGSPAKLVTVPELIVPSSKKPMTSIITWVGSAPKFLILMLSAHAGQAVAMNPLAMAPFRPGVQLITLAFGSPP